MSDSGEHARWERTGAARHEAAYDEARAALLLGQMVCDRRTALGLTQAELAARTGMTQPQLSRLESGGATPDRPAAGPPGTGAQRRTRHLLPPRQRRLTTTAGRARG